MNNHQEHPEDYWYHNQKRWKKVLRMAVDYADMFELDRPSFDAMDRLHPTTLTQQFFWHTTHRGKGAKIGVTRRDPLLEADPEFDAPTCWACICGDARLLGLSRIDMPLVLDASPGRLQYGVDLWKGFSDDFRRAIRGLRGDMANKALRSLVLGEQWRSLDV